MFSNNLSYNISELTLDSSKYSIKNVTQPSISIRGSNSDELLRIDANGTITAANSVTSTEAGEVFIDYLVDNFPYAIETKANEMLEKVAEYLSRNLMSPKEYADKIESGEWLEKED